MIEISTSIDIASSPRLVWDVLVDFSSYPMWNPYVSIRGPAARGAKIEWGYPNRLIGRIWTPAVITEFDESSLLAWSVRFPLLLNLEEYFSLQRIPNGTRVQHSAKCRGVLAKLRARALTRTFTAVFARANEGLDHYVTAHRTGAPATAVNTKPIRGKGRKKRRRQWRARLRR